MEEKNVKYRGSIVITNELLAKILGLPDDVTVQAMKITEQNFKNECLTVLLRSDKETDLTPKITEGSMIPNVNLQVSIKEEIKTITRRVDL